MRAQDRIIVALDVPAVDDAMKIVDDLGESISFYKVGLELLMAGGFDRLLARLLPAKRVFVDLKMPDDIPTTIENAVRVATNLGVRFLTLSHSVGPATIHAALRGRGERKHPELLYVPFLSSQDSSDLAVGEFHEELVRRAERASRLGADGFIVSGSEIAVLRAKFPHAPIVSPGIRPAWAASNDHKRPCTPADAIRMGSDYLVIGRPITKANDRREAVRKIALEMGG
jgi:orotidine-5'-phosphate decarboxylase